MTAAPARRADVVVLGAGMAGASAAATLAEHGASVVVLERERSPGLHATGRSAALFDGAYGNEVVRRLSAASRPFLADPPPGFSAGPLLRQRGALVVGRPADAAQLDHATATAASLVPAVTRIGAAEAIERCPALSAGYVGGAVWNPEVADIDVDALLQGHLRRLRAAGGELVVGAELLHGHRRGSTWELATSAGPVEADTLVDAAGAWADAAAVRCGVRPLGLQPLRRTAFLFDPPGGADPDWPMVIDVHERFYFKPEGGRLLGSPGDETPSEAVDARPEEIDVAVALDRIGEVLGVELRHAQRPWAGLRTFAPDRTPVVGPDPDAAGFHWLAGQGGYGIQTSPALAAASAALAGGGAFPEALAAHGLRAEQLAPGRLPRA